MAPGSGLVREPKPCYSDTECENYTGGMIMKDEVVSKQDSWKLDVLTEQLNICVWRQQQTCYIDLLHNSELYIAIMDTRNRTVSVITSVTHTLSASASYRLLITIHPLSIHSHEISRGGRPYPQPEYCVITEASTEFLLVPSAIKGP
ncbi:hypothetical protein J6590_003266 [Homalodisca vitripennis]|nr:hypothetical protein J6590_003266 [Homalodisca vitripennis]